VLGKHSGSAGVRAAFGRLDLQLAEESVPTLLERIRELAMRTKRAPNDTELKRLYLDVQPQARQTA
jgi:homocitrate synthase NifV